MGSQSAIWRWRPSLSRAVNLKRAERDLRLCPNGRVQGLSGRLRFLNAVCEMWRRGENKRASPHHHLPYVPPRPVRRASARPEMGAGICLPFYGGNKAKSMVTTAASARKLGSEIVAPGTGFSAVTSAQYKASVTTDRRNRSKPDERFSLRAEAIRRASVLSKLPPKVYKVLGVSGLPFASHSGHGRNTDLRQGAGNRRAAGAFLAAAGSGRFASRRHRYHRRWPTVTISLAARHARGELWGPTVTTSPAPPTGGVTWCAGRFTAATRVAGGSVYWFTDAGDASRLRPNNTYLFAQAKPSRPLAGTACPTRGSPPPQDAG